MNSKRFVYPGIDGEKALYNIDHIVNDAGKETFVFSNHPDKGTDTPNVWSVVSELSDSIIEDRLNKDSKFTPEIMTFYAERPERGQDGEARFSEWEATTTQFENVSTTRGVYEPKVSEWGWEDGNRMDKTELEERLEMEIKTAPFQTQAEFANQQNEDWKTFGFATRDDQADAGSQQRYQQEQAQKTEPQQATTEQEREHEQGLER